MRTRVCDLFGIEHPVVLGGMGTGTSPELVAAVSNSGGLGVQGCAGRSPDQIGRLAEAIRAATGRPFGLNLLLFMADDAAMDAVLAARPTVFSTAWPWPDFDLAALFARAHASGARVMHMISTVNEARRAAEAGADILVAQGSEGGGHVGLIGTLVLVPQVVRAVSPLPVLAAGGIADGAGLAAALMLGAEGAWIGTAFLATEEAGISGPQKQALVDGRDEGTTVSRSVTGKPARMVKNRWAQAYADAGLEPLPMPYQGMVSSQVTAAALAHGRADVWGGFAGQGLGMIREVRPAAEVLAEIVAGAERELARARALLDG